MRTAFCVFLGITLLVNGACTNATNARQASSSSAGAAALTPGASVSPNGPTPSTTPPTTSVVATGTASPATLASAADPEGTAPSSPTTSAATPAAPSPSVNAASPAFYQPPQPLAAGDPGAIIRSEPVPAGIDGATAWRVLYHSRAVDGRDIAVSGYVVAPVRPAPDGGWPVLAWAHGTTGMADQCAPTRMGSPADQIPNLADLVNAGFVVAATDYEGLGTPGVHPYGVGESEARGVLDSVRAARNLPQAHAGGRAVAQGQSQGGGAVLTVAEIAASYAPDLQILGALATGPRTELASIAPVLPFTPFFGYLIMVGVAFDSVYGTHLIDDVLTPDAKAGLSVLDTDCVEGILAKYALAPPQTILAKDPLSEPGLQALLDKNTPGNVRTTVPILVMHGGADQQIPPALSTAFTKRACATGDTVELRFYPGLGHGGPLRQAEAEIVQWLQDRLAGKSPTSSCSNVPNPPPG